MDKLKWLSTVLHANSDKNFIQRIVDKDKYPSMDNGDGSYSTHLMSWGEAGGKYVVYPSILQDPITGELKKYEGRDAFDNAIKQGDYIEFNNPGDAEWFSKNYKKYWEE